MSRKRERRRERKVMPEQKPEAPESNLGPILLVAVAVLGALAIGLGPLFFR